MPGRVPPGAGRAPDAPGGLPGRVPWADCGGRGAPGTPPGRDGALRAALTPNGLLPIRGGRGAPGTPPCGRGGRAGASGAEPAAGRSLPSVGRCGTGGRAGGAAVNAGPTEEICTGGVWAVDDDGAGAAGRDGAGATDAAGRSAAGGAGRADGTAGAVVPGKVGAAGRPGATVVSAVTRGVDRVGAPGRAEPVVGRSAMVGPPVDGVSELPRAGVEPLLPPLLLTPVAGAPPGDPGPGERPFAGAAALGGPAGNASRSLRTTGASMVEDALLTNSPNSLSLEMISLLDLPSSFASSCTRALPATALLTVRPGGWPLDLGLVVPAHCWDFTAYSRRVDLLSVCSGGSAGCAPIRRSVVLRTRPARVR